MLISLKTIESLILNILLVNIFIRFVNLNMHIEIFPYIRPLRKQPLGIPSLQMENFK